jgi:hypothetical protein
VVNLLHLRERGWVLKYYLKLLGIWDRMTNRLDYWTNHNLLYSRSVLIYMSYQVCSKSNINKNYILDSGHKIYVFRFTKKTSKKY